MTRHVLLLAIRFIHSHKISTWNSAQRGKLSDKRKCLLFFKVLCIDLKTSLSIIFKVLESTLQYHGFEDLFTVKAVLDIEVQRHLYLD